VERVGVSEAVSFKFTERGKSRIPSFGIEMQVVDITVVHAIACFPIQL
jgi:hypothetical protein